MEAISALLALCEGNSPVTRQRWVTQSYDAFFHQRLKKELSKQWRRRWFEEPWHPLCALRHTTVSGVYYHRMHYSDVLIGTMASQITSLTIVYSTVYSGTDQRKEQSSTSHVTGLCVVNSPVTGEFPAQRASNAENVSISWRHHVDCCCLGRPIRLPCPVLQVENQARCLLLNVNYLSNLNFSGNFDKLQLKWGFMSVIKTNYFPWM